MLNEAEVKLKTEQLGHELGDDYPRILLVDTGENFLLQLQGNGHQLCRLLANVFVEEPMLATALVLSQMVKADQPEDEEEVTINEAPESKL